MTTADEIIDAWKEVFPKPREAKLSLQMWAEMFAEYERLEHANRAAEHFIARARGRYLAIAGIGEPDRDVEEYEIEQGIRPL